ncbi:MAG: PaaI family thioesterase [Gammaproteobacteria bacterium]
MNERVFGNPDQALIHRFATQGGKAMPIDSNPMAQALGASLVRIDRARGEVDIGFEPADLFLQGTGVLQGGAVTAMLDFAMAFVTLASLPPQASCATVNLNTSFLRPAPQGRYLATGLLDRCGKALAFTQARLVRADTGQVVATATSSLAVVAPSLPHSMPAGLQPTE